MPHGRRVAVVNGAKRCNGCEKIKPLGAFRRSTKGTGGCRGRCRACDVEADRKRRAKNRKLTAAEVLLALGVKRCSHCQETKPLVAFGVDKRATSRRACRCLDCERDRGRQNYQQRREYHLEYGRRWRAANRDRDRANQRRRYWKNPKRARERKRLWDEANRELVNERAREWYRRAYAIAEKRARILESNARHRIGVEGGPDPEIVAHVTALYQMPCAYCGSPDDIEVDHIVPTSRGGRHEIDNLTSACGFCNRSKRDKLVEEWLGASA